MSPGCDRDVTETINRTEPSLANAQAGVPKSRADIAQARAVLDGCTIGPNYKRPWWPSPRR